MVTNTEQAKMLVKICHSSALSYIKNMLFYLACNKALATGRGMLPQKNFGISLRDSEAGSLVVASSLISVCMTPHIAQVHPLSGHGSPSQHSKRWCHRTNFRGRKSQFFLLGTCLDGRYYTETEWWGTLHAGFIGKSCQHVCMNMHAWS